MEPEKARWVRGCLERFEGPLLLYAGRLLGDPHGAQDVVQEAFVRLLAQDPAAVDPRIPAWLYAVCRNLAMDRLRRGRIMERSATPLLDERAGGRDDPAAAAALRDDAAAALRAVDGLPDRQREAVLLRFSHGLSYRETAEVMDVTVSHVGVLLHEALKTLRARMGVPIPGGAPAMKGAAR